MNKKIVSSTQLAFLLASLTMLGPFSIDAYLPAFGNIAETLHASSLEVQQTLSIYLLSFAVMTLWHGAFSDAFGRKNVILVGLAVFAIASFGCASAHSVHYLWGFRMLQGISAGAGMVVGRAIIRDLYDGPEAERLLSLSSMIFSIAPALAPIVGGWVVGIFSWRAIFLLMLLYTLIVFAICFRYLPESLPVEKRQPFSFEFLWRSYKNVFSSPLFYLKSGSIGFNFCGMFLYVSAAPAFITQHLKLGVDQFAWQFVPTVVGMFLGSMTANRLTGKWSIKRLANLGYGLMAFACIFNVGFHSLHAPYLWISVAPLFFYTWGMAIVTPGVTVLVLDLFPQIRGIVASCQSATITIYATIIAGIVAPALDFSVLALALGQSACVCIGAAMWYGSRKIRKSQMLKNN